MPGPHSKSNPGPRNNTPLVPSWMEDRPVVNKQPISPYSEADDDKIFALTCARKNARTDADATAIAWAEEEIETLRSERDQAVRERNALVENLNRLSTSQKSQERRQSE